MVVFIVFSLGNGPGGILTWRNLKELLIGDGEQMSPSDLETFLVALVGSDAKNIPDDAEYDARARSSCGTGIRTTTAW